MAYGEKKRLEVLAMLAEGLPVREVSASAGVPAPTVRHWRREAGRKARPDLGEELRLSMAEAVQLGRLRLRTALEQEREFCKMADILAEDGCSAKEKNELIAKLRIMQPQSLREIADYIETMAEKMRDVTGDGEMPEEGEVRIVMDAQVERYAR